MVDAGPWTVTDEKSLVACYDQSIRAVYRAASRLTGGDRSATDDLVQEVYASLIHKVRTGAVTEVGMGWLMTSMRHRYLDRLRGQQRDERRLRLVWSAPESPPDAAERPDLSDVPDRERAALVLHYIDDLPVAEVARLMCISVRATESLLARARRRVRARAGSAKEVRNA